MRRRGVRPTDASAGRAGTPVLYTPRLMVLGSVGSVEVPLIRRTEANFHAGSGLDIGLLWVGVGVFFGPVITPNASARRDFGPSESKPFGYISI